MADKKISALPAAATPLAGTEVLPIVQGGTTDQVSVANLTAGRAVSTGALTVVGANAVLDNAFSLSGKLVAGSAVAMIKRNSSDEVAIDEDGYGTKIGFGGRYNFAGGGNFTVGIGNVVLGTAGRGIDFSANTHAAGMTSELLNDYEEGTWTPTVTASSGTLTTVTATGNYTKVGRSITVNFQVTLTNIGTGSGALIVTLPYSAGLFPAIGTGREDQNTGVSLQLRIQSAVPGSAYVLTYANGSVIATGNVVQCTITYFV